MSEKAKSTIAITSLESKWYEKGIKLEQESKKIRALPHQREN